MKLSFVIPAYNEANSIEILTRQIEGVLKKQKISDFEIIFINDGSADNTQDKLRKLAKNNKKIKVILFRRNFGKAAALMAGFKYAQGQYIFTLDADLQDDPIEIPRFLKKQNLGYDVVVGWKKTRHDPISKTLPSKIFNKIVVMFSGVKIHDTNCGYKLFRKEAIEELFFYGELYRFLPALVSFKGFKVTEIPVRHRPRRFGYSKFGTSRLLRGLLDFFTVVYFKRYLYRPMHFFGTLGLLSFLIGFIISLYLSIEKLFYGIQLSSRPLLLLGILLIVIGVQFISFGLIGELIITRTAKDQEIYSIEKKINLR